MLNARQKVRGDKPCIYTVLKCCVLYWGYTCNLVVLAEFLHCGNYLASPTPPCKRQQHSLVTVKLKFVLRKPPPYFREPVYAIYLNKLNDSTCLSVFTLPVASWDLPGFLPYSCGASGVLRGFTSTMLSSDLLPLRRQCATFQWRQTCISSQSTNKWVCLAFCYSISRTLLRERGVVVQTCGGPWKICHTGAEDNWAT